MSKKSFEDQVDELISRKFRLVHDPCFTPNYMKDFFKTLGVALTDEQARAWANAGNTGSYKMEALS